MLEKSRIPTTRETRRYTFRVSPIRRGSTIGRGNSLASRRIQAVVIAALVFGLGFTGPAVADDESEVEQGRDLFRIHCATCHGESARGDGPSAKSLKPAPKDLTRLAAKNGGAFPSDAVFATIDGRDKVPTHRRDRMPIWGYAFQELNSDANQEEQVQSRIETLVRYLESIQVARRKKK